MMTTALLLALQGASMAGGYEVSLHGHKQIGMGLIGTSLNLDASASFYNPGALAMMEERISIQAGMSGIFGHTTFQMEHPSVYQAATDNPIGTPFYFYAAARITDRLAAGLAVNTPYGNSLAWEDGWAGRFLIQNISLRAITVQPTVSYQLTEYLSVGAGLVYAFGAVDMNRALPLEDDRHEGSVNIKGDTGNFGFNAGVLYAGSGGLNIGLSYRSRIDMEVDDARARFSVPLSLESLFPPQNRAAVTLPLPANLDFGLSYQFTPELMLGMALHYVFWDVYESLDFDFDINTPALSDSNSPREYSNSLIVRLGGQYKINESLYVRAGGYFDPSPVNDEYFSPETPSLDNLAFTTGFSFLPSEMISIDFSLLYIIGLEQEVSFTPENFGGSYASRVFIPGLGLSISL